MNLTEITSLIEKAKQATPGTKMLVHASTGKHIYSHLDNGLVRCIAKDLHTHDAEYLFAANPEAILSLAQSYLEAVALISQMRGQWIHSVHKEQCLYFLKKVGCE